MRPSDHHRPMRRAEKEITDQDALREMLERTTVLFLAFNDQPAPYVVPVCFAHVEGTLFVHSAREGRKMELLRKDPLVGFSASTELEISAAASPCEFGARTRSIVGTGSARIVDDEDERKRGMDLIMRHYAAGMTSAALVYRPPSFARTAIIAISILTLSGKRMGPRP